jgi:hypothetical protein
MEAVPHPDDTSVESELMPPGDDPAEEMPGERRGLPIPEFFSRRAFHSKDTGRWHKLTGGRNRSDQPKRGATAVPRLSLVEDEPGDRLVVAEQELARLTELHAGYATKPNLAPDWEHHLDEQAADIATQRAEVERLRAAVRAGFQARADAAAKRV